MMPRTPLHYLTISEAAERIRKLELSPVELARAFLERIENIDDRLHAYITVTAESALKEARAAEADILRGNYKGPLHGIPVAHKDLYATKGVLTTAHSRVLLDWVPDEDATAVRRLKQAGTVLLGKLAMQEFAFGGFSPKDPFPTPRNPWNLEHMPGGSSSGSGAAVAAGLCMASLGSDTGGSIRGPASHCGVVGLKPTFGRVSVHGMIPLSWSLDHAGPMAWTVQDVAIMLQTIAGHDSKDPCSSRAPVPDYSLALREDVKGLTLGVPRRDFFDPQVAHPETLAAVKEAISLLVRMGARIREVEFPSMKYARATWLCIVRAEGYAYHEANVKSQPQNYGEYLVPKLRAGALYSAADYIQAQRARAIIKHEFTQALTEVDVMVLPTTMRPAEHFNDYDPYFRGSGNSTSIFDLTGLPAISLCCGFTSDGLPIGLQIAGRPFDEPTVLRVAHTYERNTPWRQKRPPI